MLHKDAKDQNLIKNLKNLRFSTTFRPFMEVVNLGFCAQIDPWQRFVYYRIFRYICQSLFKTHEHHPQQAIAATLSGIPALFRTKTPRRGALEQKNLFSTYGRAAGNRTQSIWSQTRRTTGILQPAHKKKTVTGLVYPNSPNCARAC